MLNKIGSIALYMTLGHFPENDDLVPFPSSLMGVETKGLETLPVVQTIHPINLGSKVPCHTLKVTNGGLVTWGPELTIVVQLALDQRLPDS